MAEYIEREALKQSISIMPRTTHPELVLYSSVQKIISNEPIADVVEVVRCKDCKHFIPDEILNHKEYPNEIEAGGVCDNIDKYTDKDHFCWYGKLKERDT